MTPPEERQMLRETVASLVAKHAGPAAVRAAMASDRGYDESLWRLLCEQVGAAALVIPEELGGAGGELADAAIVVQELGRAHILARRRRDLDGRGRGLQPAQFGDVAAHALNDRRGYQTVTGRGCR